MDEPVWKNYLYHYEFDGELWAFAIKAKSHEEANRRVRCISAQALYQGEQVFSFVAPRGMGWLLTLLVRLRNWLAKG